MIIRKNIVSLQPKLVKYEIMEVAINRNIYQQAQAYAQQHGINLTAVIENFLMRFIGKDQETINENVPDVVLSLLGAGEVVDDDDLNGRDAYHKYLEEKHK